MGATHEIGRWGAAIAALCLMLSPFDAFAELPAVTVQGCDDYDASTIDELVEFELAGLGIEVDELAVICLETKVRARAAVANQALARDLNVGDMRPDDAQRFIGLNLVEMVELLNRVGPRDQASSRPAEPVVAENLVVKTPAAPPPARPTTYDWSLGVGTVLHHQLGWSGPFAGVGIETAIRSSLGFEAVADLHLTFRSLKLGEDSANATNISTSLQAAWVPRHWLSLGPGVRFGTILVSRDATEERANAYWGGLFARAQTRFPLTDNFAGTFGVEAGFSPWTYAIRADDAQQLEMRGLFTNAFFGATWH